MRVVYDSKIDDDFEGWDEDNIYELANGTRWQQVRFKFIYKYRYRPRARILEEGGRYFLEVDGMPETIEVCRVDDR